MRYYDTGPERLSTLTQTLAASQMCRVYLDFAICKAIEKNPGDARNLLKERRGAENPHVETLTKAIVPPLLAGPESVAFGAYGEEFAKLAIRPTLLGRMADVRRAPPGLDVAIATTTATAEFIGEGLPIPLTIATLGKVKLPLTKIATMSVFSTTFAKSGGDAAVSWINQKMVDAIKRGDDAKLLDGLPADVNRPASILYGVTPIGGGSPALNVEDNVADLIASVRPGEAARRVFIASTEGLLSLARQRDSGVPIYPGIDVESGGHVLGIPILISPAAGSKLTLLDQWSLLVWFGPIELDSSSEGDLQMSTVPTDLPAHLVSMWQNDLTGVRAVQGLSWALAHANGVGYLDLPI